MKGWLPLLLVALLVGACGARSSGGGRPAGQGDLGKLKLAMTDLFSALEMYAQDHSLAYPEDVAALVPKYIDEIPRDPIDGQPLRYKRTPEGYLLTTSADYSSAGALAGFPQMDQDGFFALKPSDFPSGDVDDQRDEP